jgi:asparagine synthase (glutamine-hydrolysing)
MNFQAGVLYFDGREILPDQSAAFRACAAPQDPHLSAAHQQNSLLLAHSAASRPVTSETGVITFDGRLHNRADLMRRLPNLGQSDTADAALALATYEKGGVGGLVDLIGDWSLVIWDRRQRALVLASDYAGVRPLYYCVKEHRVLWATRLRSLIELSQAYEIDDGFVAGFLAFTGSPNRTPYRGVYSVPPGCAVHLTAEAAKVVRFWQLPLGNAIRYQQDSEYDEHLRALFREAVQCRIPVGSRCLAELSGGLDSSSVVAMAADLIRCREAEPESFTTLTVEHEGSRDIPFYTAMESFCGFESIHVQAAAHPFLTETETGGSVPAFWGAMQKHTAEIVRENGITAYLTGKLGDEVMGNWWDDSDQVAGLLRRGQLGTAVGNAFAWSKAMRIPAAWILWRGLRSSLPAALGAAPPNRLNGAPDTPQEHEDSIAPALRARTALAQPAELFSRHWMQARPERRRFCLSLTQALEMRRLQAPEPLQHLDYAHPFAHRPLVSFMLAVPAAVMCGPGEPRRLMRRALQQLWPANLRRRRSKDAFGGVFLNALRPLANEMRKPGQSLQVVERGYVDPVSLQRRLDRLSMSLSCNESQLRQIILLEYWLRDTESSPGSGKTGGTSLHALPFK